MSLDQKANLVGILVVFTLIDKNYEHYVQFDNYF